MMYVVIPSFDNFVINQPYLRSGPHPLLPHLHLTQRELAMTSFAHMYLEKLVENQTPVQFSPGVP